MRGSQANEAWPSGQALINIIASFGKLKIKFPLPEFRDDQKKF